MLLGRRGIVVEGGSSCRTPEGHRRSSDAGTWRREGRRSAGASKKTGVLVESDVRTNVSCPQVENVRTGRLRILEPGAANCLSPTVSNIPPKQVLMLICAAGDGEVNKRPQGIPSSEGRIFKRSCWKGECDLMGLLCWCDHGFEWQSGTKVHRQSVVSVLQHEVVGGFPQRRLKDERSSFPRRSGWLVEVKYRRGLRA